VAPVGTGLAIVVLGLLAWQLARDNVGTVLGTAIAIKMVAFVTQAPIAAAVIRQLMRLMRVRRENSPPDCFLTRLTADLSETQHQQACKGAQDLPLPAGQAADRQVQSGLVRRHHLFANAQGLPVSRGHPQAGRQLP